MQRIDTAAAKGVIHANSAARQKSRLQKRINALGE
jgi:ribosomal protein S20